jgi:hypothetical protein
MNWQIYVPRTKSESQRHPSPPRQASGPFTGRLRLEGIGGAADADGRPSCPADS